MTRTLARDDQIMDDWMAAAPVRRRPVDVDGFELALMEPRPLLNAGAATSAGTATGSSMLSKVDGTLVVGVILQLSRGSGPCSRRCPVRFDDSDLNRAVAVAAATLVAEP
jgi:hypothetical protein